MNTSLTLPHGGRFIQSLQSNRGRLALLVPIMSIGLLLFPAEKARAADGTWINTAGGDWGTDANWAGTPTGIVANGSGFTANFNTLDITANTIVNLEAPRTIGNMVFGDTTPATVGRWTVSGTNTLTLAGTTPTITVNDMGTGSLTNSTVTISSVIAGSNGLVKNGSGTVASAGTFGKGVLVLSGSNTYTGGTTISSGALAAGSSAAFGTGAVTVSNGAQLQVRGVSIANTININGANALFSTAATGSVLSGTVNLQSNSGISLATNSGNGTITLGGNVDLNGFTLSANGASTITISGAINGGGGVTKLNNGTLRISNDNGTTYSGTTALQLGVLEVGSDGALGSGTFAFSPNNDQGATIRSASTTARTIGTAVTLGTVAGTANGNSRFIFGSTNASLNGDLTFTNTTSISLGSIQRRFEVGSRTQFDAGFTGTGGIIKQSTSGNGVGTLVLNGNNTYTGNTVVNAGTLELTDNGGMRFQIGANGINNRISGTGAVTLDGEFTFDLSGAGTTMGNSWLIVDTDALTETFGSTFNVFSFSQNSNIWTGTANGVSYQFSEATGILQVIPEPSVFAMVMVGFGMLIGYRRVRRR